MSTVWWCPRIESSLVLLEEGVCYDPLFSCKTLLAFALLHFVLQGQICLLLQVFLDFLLCIPVPCNEKDIFFCVLVLEGLVDLHRTVQLQVLHHYWLGHKLRLPWYWKIFLGNEQRSFCHFWDCIQVSLTQGTWICALWKIVEDRGAMCFKSWNHEGLDMSWQLNKH